jgi:basic membrane protein A and related proteins
VIATGTRFAPTIVRVARNFPRVRFALIDAPRDFRDASPNATYLAFDEAQSAFLAGALAARLCSGVRKPKLGFVGEADEPATRASQAGFLAGAGYVLPAFRRQGAVLAQYCGHADGVAAPVSEAQASSQYKKGAVIVFNAAGAAGRGVYAAARKAGRLAIGSGGDLPGGEIVAAVYRKGDAAVGLLIEELFASGSVKAGTRLLGLKEGMVGCSVDEAAMDGAQPRLVELEAWRALIASGSLRVPFDDASEAEFLKSLD